jgi:hypothetical protein
MFKEVLDVRVDWDCEKGKREFRLERNHLIYPTSTSVSTYGNSKAIGGGDKGSGSEEREFHL